MSTPDFPTTLAAAGVLFYSYPALRVLGGVYKSHDHVKKARLARSKKERQTEKDELRSAREAISIGNLVTPRGLRFLFIGMTLQIIAAIIFVLAYLNSLFP